MKKFNLFVLLLLISTKAFSQQLHTPAEIIKMMIDSKTSYEYSILDSVIKCSDYSNNLNEYYKYRIKNDSGLVTHIFSPNEQAAIYYAKAEKAFQSNDNDSALVYYMMTIKADSSLSNVMAYIGQIYYGRKDYDKAILWCKKAIDKNFIDFMAHWFLADAYFARHSVQDLKNAVDEVTIAQILNRNNPRIKKSMKDIFEVADRNTEDWCFNPQMKHHRISDSKVSVSSAKEWIVYAMAKALWEYEPGYRESMGVTKGKHSNLEDKECLLPLIMSIDKSKKENKKEYEDLQFKILLEATENKHIDEYIFYEILLPEHPSIVNQLPDEVILKIKDYILNIRHKKI